MDNSALGPAITLDNLVRGAFSLDGAIGPWYGIAPLGPMN